MDDDLLRAFPGYQEELREIFKRPPKVFVERFPSLAAAWNPFLKSLLDRGFDIDSVRKAASDIEDFQQWLLDKNTIRSNVTLFLIDEFISDLRARFQKRNHRSMDARALRDVRGTIECFLAFAAHRSRSQQPPIQESGS